MQNHFLPLGLNRQKLTAILNSDNPAWEIAFVKELSESPNVLPVLLQLLVMERERQKELIDDLNLLLSQSHVCLEVPETNKNNFMKRKIKEFYKTKRIAHCLANMD